MKVRVLGTAAGGGLPQWNCACESCGWARSANVVRTQDCLAVSADGSAWYLVNASPDLRAQILATPELTPGPDVRQTPIRGVLLTSAELDHTLGVLALREAERLSIYSTRSVHEALRRDLNLAGALAHYTEVSWHVVADGSTVCLDGGLTATVIAVGTKKPRYARADGDDWVIGYRFSDATSRGLIYAPCLPVWNDRLGDAIKSNDVVLLDGTFFDADEMVSRAGKGAGAQSMGHLPIRESIRALATRSSAHCFYTHLNNTNPLVRPDAAQHAVLSDAGAGVVDDGQHLGW